MAGALKRPLFLLYAPYGARAAELRPKWYPAHSEGIKRNVERGVVSAYLLSSTSPHPPMTHSPITPP